MSERSRSSHLWWMWTMVLHEASAATSTRTESADGCTHSRTWSTASESHWRDTLSRTSSSGSCWSMGVQIDRENQASGQRSSIGTEKNSGWREGEGPRVTTSNQPRVRRTATGRDIHRNRAEQVDASTEGVERAAGETNDDWDGERSRRRITNSHPSYPVANHSTNAR